MKQQDSSNTSSGNDGSLGAAAYFMIALAPIISVFFIIPLEMFINSAEYWRWHSSFPLSLVGAGVLAYLALCASLLLLRRVSVKAFARVAVAAFIVGVYVLLADLLAPLQTGPLDGSALESEDPLFFTVVEVAILASILLIANRMRKHGLRVAVLLTIGLLLISSSYLVLAVLTRAPVQDISGLVAGEPRNSGNVYHFVLDELQTDTAISAMEVEALNEEFQGFRVFRNNLANYLWTNASMPSYLTGSLYREGDFLEWQDAFKRSGLFTEMYQGGYDVHLYAVYDHWCATYMAFCTSLDEVFETSTGLMASDYITFIQIWFARIAPNAAANWALRIGKDLGSTIYGLLSPAATDIPKTIPKGKAPFSSVLLFEQLLADESDRPPTGQYVYAHAIIPHGPYVIDSDCHYNPTMWRTEGGKRAYLEQASCGIRKVSAFLEELKRLGRYEESTIIVHSDTGHGHQGFVHIGKDGQITGEDSVGFPALEVNKLFQRSENWYLARAMATLMLKPPGESAPMRIVERKSQLVDVYPTILELAGMEIGEVDGVSLTTDSGTEAREARVYFTSPLAPGEVKALQISDPKDIPASEITVLRDYEPQARTQRVSVVFGENDEKVGFSSFSYPEHDPASGESWRWSLGETSSADFSRLLEIKPGTYTLELYIQPFLVNVGSTLVVTIGGQRNEISMVEGWNRYSLQFDFPEGVAPLVQFSFHNAATPNSLGISADERSLAARIGLLSLQSRGLDNR